MRRDMRRALTLVAVVALTGSSAMGDWKVGAMNGSFELPVLSPGQTAPSAPAWSIRGDVRIQNMAGQIRGYRAKHGVNVATVVGDGSFATGTSWRNPHFLLVNLRYARRPGEDWTGARVLLYSDNVLVREFNNLSPNATPGEWNELEFRFDPPQIRQWRSYELILTGHAGTGVVDYDRVHFYVPAPGGAALALMAMAIGARRRRASR